MQGTNVLFGQIAVVFGGVTVETEIAPADRTAGLRDLGYLAGSINN